MNEREAAQKAEEKFDFYLISLVFTLLALSIQTSNFNGSISSGIFELFAWGAMLVSGLFGLWRLEYIPVIRLKRAQRKEFENELYKMKELQNQGEEILTVLEDNSQQRIQDRIDDRENAVEVLTPYIKSLEDHNLVKYKIYRVSFVVGVILIVVSRAIDPLFSIVENI